MAKDKLVETDQLDTVEKTTYKVVGLKALEDGTMPIKHKGKIIDLATAPEVKLKELYEAGCANIVIG